MPFKIEEIEFLGVVELPEDDRERKIRESKEYFNQVKAKVATRPGEWALINSHRVGHGDDYMSCFHKNIDTVDEPWEREVKFFGYEIKYYLKYTGKKEFKIEPEVKAKRTIFNFWK